MARGRFDRIAVVAMCALLAGCGDGDRGAMVTGDGIAANAAELGPAGNADAMAETRATVAAATAGDTAEAEIRALVDRVWGYYGKPFGTPGAAEFDAVMTPGLVAALKAQEDPEVGLGFDPFCACQDYENSSHQIRSVSVRGDKATVGMDFRTFASDKAVRAFTIEMARTPAGWRIDDIVTPDGGLRS